LKNPPRLAFKRQPSKTSFRGCNKLSSSNKKKNVAIITSGDGMKYILSQLTVLFVILKLVITERSVGDGSRWHLFSWNVT
jgi:hypothetical protein